MHYPGQKKKKRTIVEICGEKNAVNVLRVKSCSITRDQRRAKAADVDSRRSYLALAALIARFCAGQEAIEAGVKG